MAQNNDWLDIYALQRNNDEDHVCRWSIYHGVANDSRIINCVDQLAQESNAFFTQLSPQDLGTILLHLNHIHPPCKSSETIQLTAQVNDIRL